MNDITYATILQQLNELLEQNPSSLDPIRIELTTKTQED